VPAEDLPDRCCSHLKTLYVGVSQVNIVTILDVHSAFAWMQERSLWGIHTHPSEVVFKVVKIFAKAFRQVRTKVRLHANRYTFICVPPVAQLHGVYAMHAQWAMQLKVRT